MTIGGKSSSDNNDNYQYIFNFLCGGDVAVFWNDPLDSMQITESFGTVHQ